MSFLFPAFLLGAVAIAIPILLHLVRRERGPVVPFSAVRFVRRSEAVRTRRPRLRELLLLALRVAALLLLTVAFARPFVDDGAPARPITVVAIDRSLSMSAPEQMERAHVLAAAAIAGAPAGHQVAVVAFDDRAAVVREATDDRSSAVAAVESVSPTAGATRYAAALSAAVGVLGDRSGRIVVVTDLQGAGWPAAAPISVPASAVELAVVAPVPGNLAVTAVARSGAGVSAVVRNAADAPRDALVLLSVDDAVVETRVVALDPGASEVRFERVLPEAGVAAVEVVDREGYAGDNRRYLLLDPLPPARVLAVVNGGRRGTGAFFIDRALAAGVEDTPVVLQVRAPSSVSSLDARVWEEMDAVLILGTDGLDRGTRERLAGFVRAGGGLLVAAGPGVEPALAADVIGGGVRMDFEPGPGERLRRWVTTDLRHPLFRALREAAAALGEVSFRGAAAVDESGARTLGRFDDGTPALVEYDVGEGRALLLASDLNGAWNDFPRRPEFAPFVQETVRYLAGQPRRAREFLVADVPRGIPAAPGSAVVPASGRRIVVNADPRESDPAPMTPEAFLAHVDSRIAGGGGPGDAEVGAVQRERDQAYWWYALAAMLVVLVGEAWLARAMA